MTDERWLSVVGWGGFYEVSDRGRVRSVDRVVIDRQQKLRRLRGRMMTPTANCRDGRLVVTLRRPGERKVRPIHLLVLTAFIGPRPDGKDGCHNDGDCLNNRMANLRWDTHEANCEERIIHGVQPIGESCGASKLYEDDVREIRRRAASGESPTSISEDYCVNQAQVQRIIRRENWKHI